jgi:hypothetical protein
MPADGQLQRYHGMRSGKGSVEIAVGFGDQPHGVTTSSTLKLTTSHQSLLSMARLRTRWPARDGPAVADTCARAITASALAVGVAHLTAAAVIFRRGSRGSEPRPDGGAAGSDVRRFRRRARPRNARRQAHQVPPVREARRLGRPRQADGGAAPAAILVVPTGRFLPGRVGFSYRALPLNQGIAQRRSNVAPFIYAVDHALSPHYITRSGLRDQKRQRRTVRHVRQ